VQRERTLDGEDRSATIPLGRKVGRRALDGFVRSNAVTQSPFRAITVATLPSALGWSVSFARCKLGVLVSADAAT